MDRCPKHFHCSAFELKNITRPLPTKDNTNTELDVNIYAWVGLKTTIQVFK